MRSLKIIPLAPAAITAAITVLFANSALAHSYPDHADPKVGDVVKVAPTQVKIWFTADLQAQGSKITVTDSAGRQVDSKDTQLDEKDKTLLSVSLARLDPGTYKVSWHVVSHDGHKTKGDFQFEYKP